MVTPRWCGLNRSRRWNSTSAVGGWSEKFRSLDRTQRNPGNEAYFSRIPSCCIRAMSIPYPHNTVVHSSKNCSRYAQADHSEKQLLKRPSVGNSAWGSCLFHFYALHVPSLRAVLPVLASSVADNLPRGCDTADLPETKALKEGYTYGRLRARDDTSPFSGGCLCGRKGGTTTASGNPKKILRNF
jgi:hypothetical protein